MSSLWMFPALIAGILTGFPVAFAMLVLAVRLPTGTYLAVARPIGWALLAGGGGILLWYRARLRARRECRVTDGCGRGQKRKWASRARP